MVTLAPLISMGLNAVELVNANVINPTKVTTVLGFNDAKLTVLLVGTAMLSRVMLVHAATAGAICEYSVQ